jgi:chorismate mutase / prephenate dehydratase
LPNEAAPAVTPPDAAPLASEAKLAALRGEIDALDDALHDLLMRRAAVVARLAGSRAKDGPSPLRPGREAAILRRLLARHAGPLPPLGVLRLWREIFAISSAMQDHFGVAVFGSGPQVAQLARVHFGTLTPLHSHPTASRALAAVAAGEAQVAVLPLPEEGAPTAWWTGLDSPRLQVVARLPFWAPGAGHEALAVARGGPDPSGADRTLLRLELRSAAGAERIREALSAAGLPPRSLQFHRDGGLLRALAEVDGVVAAADPRLAALPVDRALPIGGYAVPLRAAEPGDPT